MSQTPQTFGPYRMQALAGRGGQGSVYRALDSRDGRTVALKLLTRRSPQSAKRFSREVQALRALAHPHVVRCLDAGVVDERPYLALEWVEGESLEDALRRGPLPIVEVERIGRALCDAVAYLHERSLLHRDLKPANVLLAHDGRVLLADFGLVFDQDSAQDSLTATGHMLGTPGYWPPEQALGERARIGVTSDVYGLGAVLYAALTARPPHQVSDLGGLLAAIDEAVLPPSQLRDDVPRRLEALVLSCLARDPAERPSSARVVGRELALAWEPLPAAPSRRGPWIALLAALLLAGGLAAALLVTSGPPVDPDPPPEAHQAGPDTVRTSVLEFTPLDGRDTHVRGWGLYTNDNYEGYRSLRFGYRSQGGRRGESWIYLELPELPLDGELRRVTLRLFFAGGAREFRLAVYPVVGRWIHGSGTMDATLDGMTWGPEGSRVPFPPEFTRAECAPEPCLLVEIPEQRGWLDLELTELVQEWERTPGAARVICLRPQVPAGVEPPPEKLLSVVGRHGTRERWPRLEVEHTGDFAAPAPFAERWRAHRERVEAALAGTSGAEREALLTRLIRETPGDLALHVLRGEASMESGDYHAAVRDLEVVRELVLADWTPPDRAASAFGQRLTNALLDPDKAETFMELFWVWTWAWEVEQPGRSPRPYPDTRTRRGLLQRRLLAYPRLSLLPEHLERGVGLWPDDAELREELDALPQLVTGALAQIRKQDPGIAARLAQEALDQLELSAAERAEIERYLR